MGHSVLSLNNSALPDINSSFKKLDARNLKNILEFDEEDVENMHDNDVDLHLN